MRCCVCALLRRSRCRPGRASCDLCLCARSHSREPLSPSRGEGCLRPSGASSLLRILAMWSSTGHVSAKVGTFCAFERGKPHDRVSGTKIWLCAFLAESYPMGQLTPDAALWNAVGVTKNRYSREIEPVSVVSCDRSRETMPTANFAEHDCTAGP